jgi:hypothetical protein
METRLAIGIISRHMKRMLGQAPYVEPFRLRNIQRITLTVDRRLHVIMLNRGRVYTTSYKKVQSISIVSSRQR